MPQTDAHLGTDLHLLADLQQQDERRPGNDLITAPRPQSGKIDLARLSGVDNLRQALLLRFMTPRGELAALGHRDYGSRLFELVGEPNTETSRNRAKLFVLQALAVEPRVKEVLSVAVTTRRADRGSLEIRIALVPIDGDTVLELVFPFSLAGGSSR